MLHLSIVPLGNIWGVSRPELLQVEVFEWTVVSSSWEGQCPGRMRGVHLTLLLLYVITFITGVVHTTSVCMCV